MTIDTTARQIAEEYAPRNAAELERAILRHMEHHALQAANHAYENCARMVEADPELGPKREQIATFIRGRMS